MGAGPADPIAIKVLDPGRMGPPDIAQLAGLLAEAVASGAGLGSAVPPSAKEAIDAWISWLKDVENGKLVVVVARARNDIVGAVQLALAMAPNAAHRAEIAKLMVKVAHRGRGLGTALMKTALAEAKRLGRTTLWLCTVESKAEPLYARLGFHRMGEIPDGRRCR